MMISAYTTQLANEHHFNKGLPNNKILKIFLWDGHPARPRLRSGRMPIPQDEELNFWKSLTYSN
jgi:hypothetical protein